MKARQDTRNKIKNSVEPEAVTHHESRYLRQRRINRDRPEIFDQSHLRKTWKDTQKSQEKLWEVGADAQFWWQVGCRWEKTRGEKGRENDEQDKSCLKVVGMEAEGYGFRGGSQPWDILPMMAKDSNCVPQCTEGFWIDGLPAYWLFTIWP